MHFCLFDIDGTLIASGGAGKAALEGSFEEAVGLPRHLHKVPFSGRTDRAIIRDLFRVHGVEETPERLQAVLNGYLRRLPACLASHNGRILPGIVELINDLLTRQDVTLGLLTGNVRAGARLKLGHYGLFDHFKLGGFGDRHFERDDVAREALAAVTQACNGRVDCRRIWVIGDTPLDVQCARAIGARSVAVATGWHSPADLAAAGPDLLFEDLSDPAPILAQLG